jgi:hypothetical protein
MGKLHTADVEDSCDGWPTGRGTEEYDAQLPLYDWAPVSEEWITASNAAFHHLRLQTLCTTVDVVAMPAENPAENSAAI